MFNSSSSSCWVNQVRFVNIKINRKKQQNRFTTVDPTVGEPVGDTVGTADTVGTVGTVGTSSAGHVSSPESVTV